jgi:hypothetical protein
MPTQHLVATDGKKRLTSRQIPEVDNEKPRISTRDAIRLSPPRKSEPSETRPLPGFDSHFAHRQGNRNQDEYAEDVPPQAFRSPASGTPSDSATYGRRQRHGITDAYRHRHRSVGKRHARPRVMENRPRTARGTSGSRIRWPRALVPGGEGEQKRRGTSSLEMRADE